MANWLQRFKPKSAFARGVGVLVGGTAGAQALMVLAAPLLTRLYSPEDFGLFAVYGSLLALFTVVAGLRYELAIPLPEKDEDAANVVVLSLSLVAVVSGLIAFVVSIWGGEIALLLDVPKLGDYFWLLPIGVLLIGAYQVLNYWAIRKKEFSTISQTRISQTLGTLTVQLLAFKAGGVALLLGQAMGQGIGSYTLARSAISNPEFHKWTWNGAYQRAKEYRRFPIFSTWGALFNTAGTQLPPLMFAVFFGGVVAGLYALAHRVLALPMSIIGSAVGNVFFSNASEAHRNGTIGPLVATVHEKLSRFAMLPTVFLTIAGPGLFSFAFGYDWQEAGSFARWMAPWVYMVFVTSPISFLFSVLNKERESVIFQFVLLVSRVTAVYAGATLQNVLLSVVLFSFVSALCYAAFLVWVFSVTKNSIRTLVISTLKALIYSFLCLAPYCGAMILSANELLMLISKLTSLSFASYYYLRLFR